MRNHVNLMSDSARFRATAKRRVRRWLMALAVLAMAIIPLGAVRWRQCRQVRQSHEAMEARYEPIRELNAANHELTAKARQLVRLERTPLELARKPPTTALLGLASRAASASGGELFIERLSFNPGTASEQVAADGGRMVIEAAGTLAYDVSKFVDSLDRHAFTAVKVVSAEVVSQDGVDRRKYTIECLY